MKCNGFDSDNYRYFNLNKSGGFSGYTNFSYGELKDNDIIKLSNKDLVNLLFSNNYFSLKDGIYPYHIKEYPSNEPFDLFKYIRMQDAITFKRDGVVRFSFGYGEYAFISDFMKEKMNSNMLSTKLLVDTTIKEENERMLSLIKESEKVKLGNSSLKEEIVPCNRQGYKFIKDICFELEYHKDESWSLTEPSLFLALFNQDFIRLLSNSTEIVGKDKEEIFLSEYQDNLDEMPIRYYQVKDDVKVDSLGELFNSFSLNNFDKDYHSIVVRENAKMIDICKVNRDNFKEDGSLKYFYVTYDNDFSDRIAEREILKIAVRVPYKEALKRYKMDLECIKEKRLFDEAEEFVKNHKASYNKFIRKNKDVTPVDFLLRERSMLEKRLVKTLKTRVDTIK